MKPFNKNAKLWHPKENLDAVVNRGQFSGAQNGERVGKREVEEKAENILQIDENRHHYR